MIDIHSHILPGLDDGARDFEEAIAMAKMCYNDGIDKIIATPHFIKGTYNNNLKIVSEKVLELNNKLKENNIDVEIYPGAEVYVDIDTVDEIIRKEIPTLNNGMYVLIELPMTIIPKNIDKIIFDLLIKKYIPIIAHPERNNEIISEPYKLYNFIEKGALIQTNAGSLLGEFGSEVQKLVKLMLQNKYIHFVGTDSHSTKTRISQMTKWVEEASLIIGVDYATDIVTEIPLKIINSEEYIIPEPIAIEENSFHSNFFKNLFDKILG